MAPHMPYYIYYAIFWIYDFFSASESLRSRVLSTSICCVHCYQAVCAAVAVTMQYLFLSSFFLMLVQAAALLVKLKAVLQARSRLATYCILGWGEPCLNWLGAVMSTRTFHQGPGPGLVCQGQGPGQKQQLWLVVTGH